MENLRVIKGKKSYRAKRTVLKDGQWAEKRPKDYLVFTAKPFKTQPENHLIFHIGLSSANNNLSIRKCIARKEG